MGTFPIALLLLAAGIGALVRGESVERRGALMFGLVWLTAWMMREQSFGPVWFFAADLGVLWGLVALSWKSPRPWPVYGCGFQTLVLAAHIAGWTDPDIDPRLLGTLVGGLQAATIGMLVIGAWARPAGVAQAATK